MGVGGYGVRWRWWALWVMFVTMAVIIECGRKKRCGWRMLSVVVVVAFFLKHMRALCFIFSVSWV